MKKFLSVTLCLLFMCVLAVSQISKNQVRGRYSSTKISKELKDDHSARGSELIRTNAFTQVEPPPVYVQEKSLNKGASVNMGVRSWVNFPSETPKQAVLYAVDIWSHLISSAQSIRIDAEWKTYTKPEDRQNTLAGAEATISYQNFVGAPRADKYYPVALAEMLSNSNLNGSDAEIYISINAEQPWYYGTDGRTPANQVDLVTVILHEIAHALGFDGNADFNPGTTDIPINTASFCSRYNTSCNPSIYDFYIENNQGIKLVDPQYNAVDLGRYFISDNLFFGGTRAISANRYSRPKLYAPTNWSPGSSIYHLDDNTFPPGDPNSLMKHSMHYAEAVHSPGPVALAMLEDMGWRNAGRIISVNSPVADIVVQRGNNVSVQWTDTKSGQISLNVVKKNTTGGFDPTACGTNQMSNLGTNQYSLAICNVLSDGTYKIQMEDAFYAGIIYGESPTFTVSGDAGGGPSTPIVATPTFNPSPGQYTTGQNVQILCSTANAEIYYTIDRTDPSTSSTKILYVAGSYIAVNQDTEIRAIGARSGYIRSAIAVGKFYIGTRIPPPEVFPASGTYVVNTKIIVTPAAGTVCRFTACLRSAGCNTGIAPDPQTSGTDWNYAFYSWPYAETIQFKFQSYSATENKWSEVVERTYTLVLGLRIAQLDKDGNSFGEWKRREGNQWKSYPDINFVPPSSATTFSLLASQDFKSGTTQKYNTWTKGSSKFILNHADIPVSTGDREIFAKFLSSEQATIQIELDGLASSGTIQFKDPWLIDATDQYGTPINRGPDAIFKDRVSPFIIDLNTSYNGDIYRGVFLNENPNFLPSLPVYSIKALTLPYIGFNGQFLGWSTTNAIVQFPQNYETPVVFTGPNAVVTAKYKVHLSSSSATATGYNNSRKSVRQGANNEIIHLVYESIGAIWYTVSLDNGNTWSQEITLSGLQDATHSYKNPAIALDELGALHVVWEELLLGASPIRRVQYRWKQQGQPWSAAAKDISSSQWWGNYNEDQTPSITATTFVSVAWCAQGTIVVRVNPSLDDATKIIMGAVPGTENSLATLSSLESIGGDMHLAWEQNSAIWYRSFYADPVNGPINWRTLERVSPSSYGNNHAPSTTLINDVPGIAWRSENNLGQGSSVHFRKKETVLNNEWQGTIQSYSYSYTTLVYPSASNIMGTTKMSLVWSDNGNVTAATFNGATWSSTTILGSGSIGGTHPNLNARIGTLQAVWRKPDRLLTITTNGLNPADPPPPPAPALASPANNAANVVTAPTLTWSAVSEATSYQIQVSTNQTFSSPPPLTVDQMGITSTSFEVPGLVTNTTYYWRVRGKNVGGDGAWSETRMLTTGNTINVNTVWSGQITLTQAAYIYSSATLTIAAGTYLTMPPQKYISVASGNIVVQGTANSKVTFDGVTPGQWYWPYAPIFLQGTSSATISYAEFKNSRTLLTSYFCTGSMTVSNCTFYGQASNMYQATNDGYGIEIYNDPYLDPLNIGNISISNNTFTGNGNGYAIIANNVRPSSLTISNNTISNWYSGIYSWSVGKGAISGGSINNCTYGISMIGSTSTSPSSVSNVSIQGGIYGVYITDYDSPTIQYCSIQDAYQYGIYSNGWGNVRFIGNIISKTTQIFGTYGIYARGNSATIDNNDVSSYSNGIYATPDEYMIMGRDSIRWNNIHNVATAIVAYGIPTGVVVQNNIISANRTGTFAFYSYGSERIEYNKIISEGADPNYTTYYGLGVNGNYAPTSITKNEFSGFYGAIYFQTSSTPSVYYSQNNLRSNYYSCVSNVYVHFENNFVLSCPSTPGYVNAYVFNSPWLSSPASGTGPGGSNTGGGNNSFPTTCDGPYSQMNPGNDAGEIKLTAESPNETPKEFLLSQNHPNPFNPETIIQYQLPKESFVSLRIYDMLGREVRRLVDQQQKEGYYSSRWNGKNNVGEPVSSGVYIYRLVASSVAGESPFMSTHKMILAR